MLRFSFLLFCSHLVSSEPVFERYQVTDRPEELDEINWMLHPGARGNLAVAILSGLEPAPVPIESVQFLLYTKENPKVPERKFWNASCKPVFKYFQPSRPTKILIHGFGDSASKSYMFPVLTEAYLAEGDYNIFAVDWSELAEAPWYLTAARNTDRVGIMLANLLDFMVHSAKLNLEDVHIIGFSLGSHVAGATGRAVKSGTLARITGLDPAQVLFTRTPIEYRLDPTDALLVEIVHTSGGYLGFGEPIGHRDFFPNGGSWPQPGCVLDYAGVCSHQRAYYYYAENIRSGKGFKATICDTYPHFSVGSCNSTDDNSVEMYNHNMNTDLAGKFFLDTNSKEPFGKFLVPQ